MQWVKGSGVAAAATEVATMAWTRSLTQELPYASGAAVKLKKKKYGALEQSPPIHMLDITCFYC